MPKASSIHRTCSRLGIKSTCSIRSELPLRLVIFDMDGVIVDSKEVWYRLVRFLCGGLDRKITRGYFNTIFGQGTDRDAITFFPTLSVEEVEVLYSIFFPCFTRHLKVMNGAQRTLVQLKRLGIKLACCTNTPYTLAKITLLNSGLMRYFSILSSPNHGLKPKPSPDMINDILDRSGIARKYCIYIGDSIFDEESCRKAGVKFVGYKYKAPCTINRLNEILHLIN